MHRRYPLQVTISSLFIVITVLLGLILSWQSFNKTSDIMLDSAEDLHEKISQELILDFKATYGQIAGAMRQFRLSPVIKAKTFSQRIRYLPGFQAIIDSDASVFAVGIGYGNGDYFSLSPAQSEYIQQKYTVPVEADYVLQYVKSTAGETGFDGGKQTIYFYDKNLKQVSHRVSETTDFDPRLRLWYQQASGQPAATRPYLFYDSNIVGVTAMSKTTEPGSVVMFDVTLKSLGETIAKHKVSPDSEVVLINAAGQVFAYKDQQKIIVKDRQVDNGRLQLANLKQLDSKVLTYISDKLGAEEQRLDFVFDQRRWIGSTNIVAKPGGVALYALMLSPVDELLADAVSIRNELIYTAIFILLLFIPLIWYTSKRISKPLQVLAKEAEAISRFDFESTRQPPTFIKEVADLDAAMELMKSTINKFIGLINSLAGEQDLDVLLKNITSETMSISHSDAAVIYMMDEQDDSLKATFLCEKDRVLRTVELPAIDVEDAESLLQQGVNKGSGIYRLKTGQKNNLSPLLESMAVDSLTAIVLPLQNRNDELIGMLCLMYIHDESADDESNIEFVEALSGFAAVTLESRQLFRMQEMLLHSFIKLIAGAIDAKSPYTGGHCTRVPEITLMLAKAACDSDDGKFKDFDLDEKQWQELSIAGWLHDCGKVTTPEYVVDKATKLETIYDRIHEVRMRFEVLKRDAEITCWQQIAEGGDRSELLSELADRKKAIDEDFAFVAECNVGGEFMADDKITRLQSIAEKTWRRTLDDNLGVSWEELNRKQGREKTLPVEEKLLSDKPEHLIARHENDRIPEENPWGFDVETPEFKYNRGELYNLSVARGTLSEEERYMINGHMIQTIMMLDNLPFPKHLRDVSLIAGSHHETMDGKGYPKKLLMTEQPWTARMMAIADIFEALTASDRPYKKAKPLSESLRILSFMRNDKHIDPDLFELFLRSGVYLEYAQKFLSPEQIDDVDIEDYI